MRGLGWESNRVVSGVGVVSGRPVRSPPPDIFLVSLVIGSLFKWSFCLFEEREGGNLTEVGGHQDENFKELIFLLSQSNHKWRL